MDPNDVMTPYCKALLLEAYERIDQIYERCYEEKNFRMAHDLITPSVNLSILRRRFCSPAPDATLDPDCWVPGADDED